MTNEEAIRHIECVAKNAAEGGYDSAFCSVKALILVAELLKAKPCEDAISRQAMLDGLISIAKVKARSDAQKSLMGRIMFFTEQLPPVTSKPAECEDCVSREAVLDALHVEGRPTKRFEYAIEVRRDIEALPPATPRQKIGKWIEERNDYGEIQRWHCSECYEDTGFTTNCKWDFCPSCGAKME